MSQLVGHWMRLPPSACLHLDCAGGGDWGGGGEGKHTQHDDMLCSASIGGSRIYS